MKKAHATLGASSSHRWFECPGSIQASEGIPNIESEYAREGSAAHSVAEVCLNGGHDAEEMIDRPIKDFPDIECTDEMAEAVQLYLDTVRLDMKIYADAELDVEMKFDLSHIYPNCFGTNDALIYSPSARKLTVYDYKHGRGVAVEAKNNSQMLYYATGALTGKHNRGIEVIELVIVQPRCAHEDGPVRRWTLGPVELLEFIADLQTAAKRTEDPNPVFKAGDHCQFCPAAPTCKTLREKAMEIAQADFATGTGEVLVREPVTFKPEELAKMLREVDVLENWVKSLRAYCHMEAMNGRTIPGFKLVDRQARRKWKNEDTVGTAMKKLGLDGLMFNMKLKSPAQMEKLLKEKKFDNKVIGGIVAPLCEAISSGTNLVSVDNKKAATRPLAETEFL